VVIKGISDPTTLETMVCREALALARDLSLGHIQVVSDCLEVISSLVSENLGRFIVIMQEIKASSSEFG
jgi:hypothetical protein